MAATLSAEDRPNPPDFTSLNIRYLYLEILFASVLGAIINFNSAFAIHLGASNTLIALLNSAPSLLAAVASIPAARYMARRQNRRLWLWGSLFVTRFGYLVVALMPLLIPYNTATWLVVWIIALNLPSIFFTNGFQVLLADLIPERKRAFVLSRRQVIWSVGIVIVSILSGAWLDHVSFPLNYVLLYSFGFLTVLGSHYYLHKITFPETQRPTGVPLPMASDQPVPMKPPIRRMLINITIYTIGLSLPAPLFNIYYINHLHTTDGWLGINSAAGSLGVVVGYLIWERLLRRHTFSWAQRRASLFTWVFPVTLGLIPDLNVIMASNLFVNVMHSGVDLANFNVLLKISQPHERAAYVSWFNAAISVSTFIAPLVGVWIVGLIGDQYGIQSVLVLAGLLRLLGGVLFNINKVEDPGTEASPMPA